MPLGVEDRIFICLHAELFAIADPAADHAIFDPIEAVAASTFWVGYCARPLDAAARRTVAGFDANADRYHAHDRAQDWLIAPAPPPAPAPQRADIVERGVQEGTANARYLARHRHAAQARSETE